MPPAKHPARPGNTQPREGLDPAVGVALGQRRAEEMIDAGLGLGVGVAGDPADRDIRLHPPRQLHLQGPVRVEVTE